MKTTTLIITALFGFFINAALAGNHTLGTKYSSDYFYRGALKSQESIQLNVGTSGKALGLDYSLGAFANQSIDNGTDTYILSAGVSKSFLDSLVSVYAGVNHVEDVDGEALMEGALSFEFNTLLSPTVSVFRDLDQDNWTTELAVSHSVDLTFASLGLGGSVGNTENTASQDETYYSIDAGLSKAISEKSAISLDVSRVDSDSIGGEYVLGLGVSVQF